MADMFKPGPALLCKLASIAVHAEEMLGPNGHAADRAALLSCLQDPEVAGWMTAMADASLAPVKRSSPDGAAS